MKIGDEVYVHGYVDEIRKDVIIIRNDGGYFGTVADECYCYEEDERGYGTMNSADTPQEGRSEFVKVSDRECPWCKAVCASTDKYCHECGWHIADTPQTDCDHRCIQTEVGCERTDCPWK